MSSDGEALGCLYVIFICICLGIWATIEIISQPDLRHLCAEKTVSSVGGCDEYGRCGTEFTDGTYGQSKYPSKGRVVTVNEWTRDEGEISRLLESGYRFCD